MVSRVLTGVCKRLSWAVVAAALGASGAVACGDDPAQTPENQPAVGGGAGAPDVIGQSGESPIDNAGGSAVVAPGDRVCSNDDDCTDGETPVCDQVLGCVACQYDWDCPTDHRCRDNACFAKRACSNEADCAGDSEHLVCDAVQQLCVGCRESSDCGDGHRCEASECVPFEACTNSRDCSTGKVCDAAVGACVACVVDGDCGDGNACVNNACVPTCASDKDCLGIGLLCDLGVGRCVECLRHQDCPAQYFCGAGNSCALDLCEPGQARCESEHQLATCSEVGDTFTTATCAGNTACVEDGLTASCTPLVCTPSLASCSADGSAIEHCSGDGLSIASSEPCSEGQACSEAACVDVVCAPDAYRCDGNTLRRCNTTGTQEAMVEYCTGQFGAVCDDVAGACKPLACQPGSLSCSGNTLVVCAEDGQGPAPDGTDCGLTQQACFAGQCQPKVCSDPFVCDGNTLQRCDDNGTKLVPVKDCGAPALCDAAGGKCIKATCTPGAFVCDGNVATRCKADGSGYAAGGTDCAANDLVCDGGGCLPKVCTPDASFCQGGNPQKCSPSGAQYVPSDVCQSYEYCSASSTFCQYDKCTASTALCNGNLATTCAADGSGPVPGGTDCSAQQQICEAGACKAVVCQSGVKTCQGEAVYVCNPSGTGTTLFDSCSKSEFCDASGEVPVCAPDLCSAGSLGCNGEVISTCDTNGGSWINPGLDCAASDQVCVLGGTCAAEEQVTQGGTYTSLKYSNGAYFSGFRVLTSRKLTKLEAYVVINGLQKVTWVVYEKRAGSNTYDLVHQVVTAQTMATAGFISSPALDFELEQGKSYAIGLHISGPSQVYAHYNTPARAAFLTEPLGAYATTGSAQPDASLILDGDYNPYLRFTTTLP